jgi:hypothetical protein
MQHQVDQLDQLKSRYYEDVMGHEEEIWDTVQGKVCQSAVSVVYGI